jgi:hypothetical protein
VKAESGSAPVHPGVTVDIVGAPTDAELAADVARAVGLGLVVGLGQWLALTSLRA